MLTAVESSGDALGGALVQALRDRLGPGARFIGVGGPAMARQGVDSPFDPASLAIVGAFDAMAAYPMVRRRVRQTADLAMRERPDVAVLIDAWGFSIRVARALRRADPDLPLVKYVAPQVWATRPGRARTLARAVDRLLTIHVFDAPIFEREGLETVFVGNPALVRSAQRGDATRFRAELGIGPTDPLLLVLPGSRRGEVRRLMPHFGDAVRRLGKSLADLTTVVAAADQIEGEVEAAASAWARPPIVVRGAEARVSAMDAATLALACSGTVTTELALVGCPMVVAYRLGPLTHMAAKLLIRTPYITLFNVAAGRFVAPERVQRRCSGAVLARDLAALLDNPERRLRQAEAQTAALDRMSGGISDPVGVAADAVIDILRGRGWDQPRASSGL
jgi:lipid-A-disaccharide synthase